MKGRLRKRSDPGDVFAFQSEVEVFGPPSIRLADVKLRVTVTLYEIG